MCRSAVPVRLSHPPDCRNGLRNTLSRICYSARGLSTCASLLAVAPCANRRLLRISCPGRIPAWSKAAALPAHPSVGAASGGGGGSTATRTTRQKLLAGEFEAVALLLRSRLDGRASSVTYASRPST